MTRIITLPVTGLDLPTSDDVIGEHRDALDDGWPGMYLVRTANSTYTIDVHGENQYGYVVADVHCPAHPITGADAALLLGAVPRLLDDRLVVVDADDVRCTLFRSSPIHSVHYLEYLDKE